MCHFITVILPNDANVEEVCRIASSCGASFSSIENPSVREHLRPGDGYFRATARHCDCGTVLGASDRRRKSARPDDLKGKRRGWSAAKVERWRQQRSAADESRAARASVPPENEPDWIRLVRELDAAAVTSSMVLLLHFYATNVRDEAIGIRGRQRLWAEGLDVEQIAAIRDDVLCEIVFRRTAAP